MIFIQDSDLSSIGTFNQTRILIVENDEEIGNLTQEYLEIKGFDIELILGSGHEVIKRAIIAAQAFRPHVAIIDLRISGNSKLDGRRPHDVLGLDLLSHLSDAKCILRSAYLTVEVTRKAFRQYKVFDVISSQSSPQEFVHRIQEAAFVMSVAACKTILEWQSIDPFTITHFLSNTFSNMPYSTLEDLLAQLFPNAQRLKLSPVGDAQISSEGITRHSSLVLKVWADDLEPVIVKIAPTSQLEPEKKNNELHVNGRLGGLFYADIQNSASFWGIGGTVYRFLGQAGNGISSFPTHYATETNTTNILNPLRHFFLEVWLNHYQNKQPIKQQNLFELYDKGWYLTKRLQQLNQLPSHEIRLPDGLPNPIQWLIKNKGKSNLPTALQAITHGDLHGDNLFIKNKHAWAIDFERTGPSHIFRDFVELETDILTRLAFPSDFDPTVYHYFINTLYNIEQLNEPPAMLPVANDAMIKAQQVINGLRQIAFNVCDADLVGYWWGVLFDAILVATVAPNRKNQALLLAATICRRLDDLL